MVLVLDVGVLFQCLWPHVSCLLVFVFLGAPFCFLPHLLLVETVQSNPALLVESNLLVALQNQDNFMETSIPVPTLNWQDVSNKNSGFAECVWSEPSPIWSGVVFSECASHLESFSIFLEDRPSCAGEIRRNERKRKRGGKIKNGTLGSPAGLNPQRICRNLSRQRRLWPWGETLCIAGETEPQINVHLLPFSSKDECFPCRFNHFLKGLSRYAELGSPVREQNCCGVGWGWWWQ